MSVADPAFLRAAERLRKLGVNVAWANYSGRPGTFAPRAMMRHHDVSPPSDVNGALEVCLRGRSDLPGPLCQWHTARDGKVVLLTDERANHGGAGGPWRGVPADSANAYIAGHEVANNGTGEPYPAAQLEVVRLVDACFLIEIKRDASWLLGHKEWAPGRKVDPLLSMDAERDAVAVLIEKLLRPAVTPKESAYAVVRSGDTLYAMAQTHKTTVADLQKLNNLGTSTFLRVGQRLRLPGAPPARKPMRGLFRIDNGKPVYQLSKRWVTREELREREVIPSDIINVPATHPYARARLIGDKPPVA